MAHHTNSAGNIYVDSDFVNDAQRVPEVELRHLGFGEFVFTTPKGEVEVDRMRGEDFEGQKGRSHKLYDDQRGSGAAEWLVAEVERHNLSQRLASGLRSAVIRLAHVRDDLRPHLLPLLVKWAGERTAATKKYIMPVTALSNEMHEKASGMPVGTRLKVWVDADSNEPRLFLDIERTYDGYLDKFMESEIPEDIGISNKKEVEAAIERWAASSAGQRVLSEGHTWDFTSRS